MMSSRRLKILVLTKFPPTQGGEASKSFWLVRGLAERGHEIHVLTNANETDAAFFVPDATHPREHLPDNVTVHILDHAVEFHTPFSRAFCERLANRALEIVGQNAIDVIEAAHLTPFGAAALIVKACTGLPFVQRHGGSDVGYLWESKAFGTLISRIVSAADRMMINAELAPRFMEIGIPYERLKPFGYFLDPQVFRPEGPRAPYIPTDVPTILFSGKVTPGKRLFQLMEAMRDLTCPAKLILLPVGFKLEMIRELAERFGVADRTIVLDPRPCWEMPSVLRSVSIVCCLETNFTTSNHWPLFPREVMASGTSLVLSQDQYHRRAITDALDGEHLFAVNADDPESVRSLLERLIPDAGLQRRVGAAGAQLVGGLEDYGWMLDNHEAIYFEAIEHAAAHA